MEKSVHLTPMAQIRDGSILFISAILAGLIVSLLILEMGAKLQSLAAGYGFLGALIIVGALDILEGILRLRSSQ